MISRILFLVFTLMALVTEAQVSNNNIKNRTELLLNAEPVHSSTDNSSVEWGCVNKALTNKCLVYHNDQWFHFTPHRGGKFFLNISSQHCRDLQGIQLILIEGNPCEVSTYRILQCISKIHQDDVFVELDSLKPGTQYLVNIDGFLGDFCKFDIQFSTMPSGLPRVMINIDTLKMTTTLKDSVVTIQWTVDRSIAEEIKMFNVYRLAEVDRKSKLVRTVPLRANALGDFEKSYVIHDSLTRAGKFAYRIFGTQNETELPILLDEQWISFYPKGSAIRKKGSSSVFIPLKFNVGEQYKVLVFDKVDFALLRKYNGEFDATKDTIFEIDLDEFITRGVREFVILATDAYSKQTKEHYFFYDGREIIKQ